MIKKVCSLNKDRDKFLFKKTLVITFEEKNESVCTVVFDKVFKEEKVADIIGTNFNLVKITHIKRNINPLPA